MTIRFGTDGWRAVISDEFTFENVRLVAQAIAEQFLASAESGSVPVAVVGFDTRFLLIAMLSMSPMCSPPMAWLFTSARPIVQLPRFLLRLSSLALLAG